MIEPEVLFSGSHDIKRAEAVTTQALQIVFDALIEQRVDLKGVILKSSMVLAGSTNAVQTTAKEVAEATLRTFKNAVPEEVGGIVFLSGGQTPERATENLDAIAEEEKVRTDLPWEFAFSYSRALEEPVLDAWRGKVENVGAAQEALLKRLKLNSLADVGEYEVGMEK
jgi:fructose-bisphosphate aldolase class I